MQVLQVPLWLVVVVGAAVPAGIALGAWLGRRSAARRDAQRWRHEHERDELRRLRDQERDERQWLRERDREEIRWQRDREQVAQARRSEFDKDLWERRLAAFATFLSGFDKVHGAACLLSLRGRSSERAQESLDTLEQGIDEAMKAFDVLRVIAGADLVEACYDAVENAAKCWDHDGSSEASAKALDSLVTQREGLHTKIRISLGIEAGPV
jgi:hypothetical protein